MPLYCRTGGPVENTRRSFAMSVFFALSSGIIIQFYLHNLFFQRYLKKNRMPEILWWTIIFFVSLFVLVKSSDWFIEAAEEIGISLGLPAFLVGLTIVALGTSIPELASSVFAVLKGSTEIVVSNVVGSNITNVFLVLGTVMLVAKRKILNLEFKIGDLVLLLFSAGFLIFACFNDYIFTKSEAAVCVFGIFAYVGFHFWSYKKDQAEDLAENGESQELKIPLKASSFFILLAAGVGICFSADYNIEAILKISDILDIGKEFISLSAVALGTSLPELFVSIAAAKKDKLEIAFGNIMGSNILNVFVVMGIPGLISAIVVPNVLISHGFILMAIATLALVSVLVFRRLHKIMGIGLLCLYGYFIYVCVSMNMIG